MCFVVPLVEHRDRTIFAVNLGGAVIPVALSIDLPVQNQLFVRGAIGIVIVSAITHVMAHPFLDSASQCPLPVLSPPTIAAAVALQLDREHAAPLAYFAGSVDTLLGADISNLHLLQEFGAAVASIACRPTPVLSK